MNRFWIVLIAAMGLFAVAVFWLMRRDPRVEPTPVASPKVSLQAPFRRPVLITASSVSQRAASESAPPVDSDALEQVSRLLPKATAEDADAQYRVYELLSGCKTEYWYYFGRGDFLPNKEEAEVRMEALASVDPYARDVYSMCHRLMQEQSQLTATAENWLEKALARGHPKAQTARATELLAAVAVHNPEAGQPAPPNAERDARDLLTKAMASGDPHVLWMLGELRPVLGGSAEETNKERWAMELAACNRGLDCGPEAEWVKRYCKADPANLCPINANAEEMIRSKTGSDFEMINLRAQEINALIDAGNARQLVPSP